jgi:hypothetical protein
MLFDCCIAQLACCLAGNGPPALAQLQLCIRNKHMTASAAPPPGSTPDPDYLGARMDVSSAPTASGVTIAVAAKRGRVACVTASLDGDGVVHLSSPVLYAVPAPRILGASYQLVKRDMELGDIIDLVLLPSDGGAEGRFAAAEHLAVLSHRSVCIDPSVSVSSRGSALVFCVSVSTALGRGV